MSVSHVSQLLHELQLLSQLLHLSPHGELRINRLQTLVASQEHCKQTRQQQAALDWDRSNTVTQPESVHIRRATGISVKHTKSFTNSCWAENAWVLQSNYSYRDHPEHKHTQTSKMCVWGYSMLQYHQDDYTVQHFVEASPLSSANISPTAAKCFI